MTAFIPLLLAFWTAGDKTKFFPGAPADFLFTAVGISYVLIIFLVSFAFGFLYQTVLKKLAAVRVKRTTSTWKNRARTHNIGNRDRWLRAIIGAGLFVHAVTGTWSPTLLFFSGFCFFEAIFSWCGFYAAIGRNSCPI